MNHRKLMSVGILTLLTVIALWGVEKTYNMMANRDARCEVMNHNSAEYHDSCDIDLSQYSGPLE